MGKMVWVLTASTTIRRLMSAALESLFILLSVVCVAVLSSLYAMLRTSKGPTRTSATRLSPSLLGNKEAKSNLSTQD
jgi:hypothetical protein